MAARSVAMKNLEFKRNLSIYLSFVKNYKLIVISLLIVILSVEVMFLIEKYLFKLLIDRGTEFTADILTRAAFIDSIITLALIFLSIT